MKKYLLILFTFISFFSYSEIVNQIYIIVNSKIITKINFDKQFNFYKSQNKELKGKKDIEIKKSVANSMIEKLLLEDEAERQDINITDNEIDSQIKQIMKMNHIPDIDTFKYALKQQHIDFTMFKEKQKEMITSQKLISRVITISEPTIKEVGNYYEVNKNKFKTGGAVKVSQILIKTSTDMGFKEMLEKENQAKQIKRKLDEGMKFEDAVKLYSEDDKTKISGGYMGYVEKKDMPKNFIEVAFKIKLNTISKIISTKYGFHIIKVAEKVKSGIKPLSQVSQYIKNILYSLKQQKEFKKYLKKLKKKAVIKYKIKELGDKK